VTIDEAIEILKDLGVYHAARHDHQNTSAIRLGIEALKQHQLLRIENREIIWLKLPSETEK